MTVTIMNQAHLWVKIEKRNTAGLGDGNAVNVHISELRNKIIVEILRRQLMKTAYINGIILDGKEDMAPVAGMTIITNGEFIESG